MKLFLFVYLSLISLFFVGQLEAEDFFISNTGNDGNRGTLKSPWKTFKHAVSNLNAGDTLILRAGIYKERLMLKNIKGLKNVPVIIRNYKKESPIIDGSNLKALEGDYDGLVSIKNCDYLHVIGLDIRNFVTTNSLVVPVGIYVEGQGDGVKIARCKVHHIWQNSKKKDSNALGIGVYGYSKIPIDGIELSENEIYDLRTGRSESMVINGNVTRFKIIRNHVHDCNNIGIDMIGYEKTAPTGFDRARHGLCSENIVHHISSTFNPGYGGDFLSGGGEASASGIYVDGGTDIVIERNHVYQCDYGVELASEHAQGSTDYITLRNNLINHNAISGMALGGYDSKRGKTQYCIISNNVFYHNDMLNGYNGQVYISFYFSHNKFVNNILWASSAMPYMIVHYTRGGAASQRAFDTKTNIFDHNVYYSSVGENKIAFGLNSSGSGSDQGNTTYEGLNEWRKAIRGEGNSQFGNPQFIKSFPSKNAKAKDFELTANSICIDAGAKPPLWLVGVDEIDYFGVKRLVGARVDIGFSEFQDSKSPEDDHEVNIKIPDKWASPVEGSLVDITRLNAGKYSGFLTSFSGEDTLGYLKKMKVNAKGKFSVKFFMGKTMYALKGEFKKGFFKGNAVSKDGVSVEVKLEMLQTKAGAYKINGSLTKGNLVTLLTAVKAGMTNRISGCYTLLVLEKSKGKKTQSYGYALMKVNDRGAAKIKGFLGDGRKWSAKCLVTKDGEMPLYAMLYKKSGSLAGMIRFRNNRGISDCDGRVNWIKSNFFKHSNILIGSRFKNKRGRLMVGLNEQGPNVTMFMGDFISPEKMKWNLDWTVKNKLVDINSKKVKIKVKSQTGLLKGRFPIGKSKWNLRGVLFQKQHIVAGAMWNREGSVSQFRILKKEK